MKRRILVISLALFAVAALFVTGCLILPIKPPVRQIDNAAEVYNNAVLPVRTADDLSFCVSKTRKTTIGSNIFTEQVRQTVNYIGLTTENPQVSTKETSSIGTHSISISEHYNEGTAYVQVGEGLFSCEVSFEDYFARLSPAVMLDASLYGSITGTYDGSSYTVHFSQPTDPEQWMSKATSGFLDAKGTAHVSSDGQLTQSIYTIKYTQGNAIIELTVIIEPISFTPEINLPEDTSGYNKITYLDGPRTLERATGYLLQAENVSANYNDSIYFQAFGEERTQSISLFTSGTSNWSALVSTEIALQNDARNDKIINHKTELFLAGQYKSNENGGEYNISKDVSTDDMRTYCQNLLVSTVMLPHHITDAQVTEKENTLLISFTASEEFAQIISENACQSMYQNSNLLIEQAQENSTDALNCYLEIDKLTGFPVSSGIHYTGTYLMENIPYLLRFNAEQTYNIISLTAKNEIEKAAG